MNRAVPVLIVPFATLLALAQTSDLPNTPADAHAPLFRPKAPEVGKTTDRLAAGLPAAATDSAPIPRRNFIDDEIFGRMKRDGIPHAPLATDSEFIRESEAGSGWAVFRLRMKCEISLRIALRTSGKRSLKSWWAAPNSSTSGRTFLWIFCGPMARWAADTSCSTTC